MNENTIKWVKAAGVRAVKTMAQTAIATPRIKNSKFLGRDIYDIK